MSDHLPDCDVNDTNPAGIKKPCNCGISSLPASAGSAIWRLVHHYDRPTWSEPSTGRIVRNFDPESWSLRRRNRTSGKSGWGTCATGMGEYAAKTICNDANRGGSCFRYQVISPQGDVFELTDKGVINEAWEAYKAWRPTWTQTPPTLQGEYWHWNGDTDSAPQPMFVMWSGTSQKCFVSANQLGITEAIDCDTYGGWWLKMMQPPLPNAESSYPADRKEKDESKSAD